MKPKYIGCSTTVQEDVYLRVFLHELDIVACNSKLATIYYYSLAALTYIKDPKYHSQTKHIDTRYYFIQDMVAQKEVVLEHISMS